MELSLTAMLIALLIQLAALYIANIFVLKTWNYFTERRLRFDRGVPILGSLYPAMLQRQSLGDCLIELCRRFQNDKIFGFYQMGGKAAYMIHDPELIKTITIKEFDTFVNRGFSINTDVDPLLGRTLFNLNDDKWRELRSIMSPLFTGSKMRMMLGLMGETIEEFVSDVKKEVSAGGADGAAFNLKEIFTCITNDAIASCAFGLKVNSFVDRSNEFYVTGHRILASFESGKFLFTMCFPKLTKWLNVTLVAPRDNQFFRDLVDQNVEERKRHGIVRNDMIHMLLLLREGKLDAIAEKEDLQDAGFATVSEILSARTTEKLKSKLKNHKPSMDCPAPV